MAKSLDQLLVQAEQIESNVLPNSNTAGLVGDTIKGVVEHLQAREYGPVAGYVHCESLEDLPTEDLTPTEKKCAYIVDGHFYVFVGEGGDTLDGRYQDCGELRGATGGKGDKGEKGDPGVLLDPEAVELFDSIDDIPSVQDPDNSIPTAHVVDELLALQTEGDEKIQTALNGKSAIVDIRSSRWFNKSGCYSSSSASNYKTVTYDVTHLLGSSVTVHYTKKNNTANYQLVRHWQDIGSSAAADYTTENLLRIGSNTSGTSDNYNALNVSLAPSSTGYAAMAEHVSGGGRIFLIVTLYKTREPDDFLMQEGIVQAIEKKQDILEMDDTPEPGSTNPVTSDGVHGALLPLRTEIFGVSALVEKKEGRYLFYNGSTKLGYYTNNSDYGTFNCHIYDVTDIVGTTVMLYYSKRVNTKTYMLVDDYTAITTSSTNIHSHILAMGTTVSSNVAAASANIFSLNVPLNAAAVMAQAAVGRVYLIVNLRQDYEQKNVFLTEGLKDRIGTLEGTRPIWLEDEKKRIIELVRQKMEHEIVVFGFNTDQHIRMSSREIYTLPVLRGLNAMRDMAEEIPFSLICLGGDAPGYGTDDQSQEAVTQEVLEVIRATDTDRCPVVYIAGNHDGFQNAGTEISDGRTLFNAATKRNAVRRQLDGFHPRSTNAWFDDAANKVRFIFVDPWSRCTGPGSSTGMRHAAATAILTEALADSKLENSEWMVLIFCHNVLADGVDGNNYAPASAGSVNHWADEVMPRVNQGVRVVACFNGHAHNAGQGVKDGTLFIRSHTSNKSDISQSWDGITYEHVAKTATETSQDVFVLDKTEGKIYAYQFGAGMDRVFVYGDGNPRIALCHLSGIVTVDGQPASGTLTATHHNTAYSCVLGADGSYDFPHLCPECEWGLSLDTYGGDIEPYAAEEGSFTHNIVL